MEKFNMRIIKSKALLLRSMIEFDEFKIEDLKRTIIELYDTLEIEGGKLEKLRQGLYDIANGL